MAATRPIEDFFCNPTFSFAMDDDRPRTSMTSDMSFEDFRRSMIIPPQEMFSFKPGKKTSEPAATIKSFTEDPIFWRGYNSEEEVASPVCSDDMSFHSASSDSDQASDLVGEQAGEKSRTASPEQLGERRSAVEQQCSRAQAVTLVSAGKAKVISMPRLVDVSASPRARRPAAVSIRQPVSRMSRQDVNSRPQRVPSEEQRNVQPTAPVSYPTKNIQNLSIDTQTDRVPYFRQRSAHDSRERQQRTRTIQQRPSLPNLRATACSEPDTPSPLPAHSARLPHTSDFLKHDPYPSQSPAEPTTPLTPMSPARKRLHKISSSIGLNVFGRDSKRSDPSDNSLGNDLDRVEESSPVTESPRPQTATSQIPARTPSRRPKLVARGANERAPPLVLPPCPESYECGSDVTSWPQRSDSATTTLAVSRYANMGKLHKRQRSMSAALVPAQA